MAQYPIEMILLSKPTAFIEQDRHGAEDRRVGIVEIPLEVVEGGPDPAVHILAPGEAAAPHGRTRAGGGAADRTGARRSAGGLTWS